MGIDYDRTRNELLVADTGNDRIIRLTQDGRYLGKHGASESLSETKAKRGKIVLIPRMTLQQGGFQTFTFLIKTTSAYVFLILTGHTKENFTLQTLKGGILLTVRKVLKSTTKIIFG